MDKEKLVELALQFQAAKKRFDDSEKSYEKVRAACQDSRERAAIALAEARNALHELICGSES